MDTYTVGLQPT